MDSNPQNSFFSSPPAQDPSHYDDLSAPLQPSPDPLPTPASPLDFQQPVSQPEMALSALEQPEASTSTALEQPDAAQKPVAAPAAAKKKATDAAASNGMRKPLPGVSAPGETLLPTSRVARIIKLDPDVAMTSKEAIFLIAKMTERFLRKLADAGYTGAQLGGRRTLDYKDLSSAVREDESFHFLETIIPPRIRLDEAQEKRRKLANEEGLTLPEDEEAARVAAMKSAAAIEPSISASTAHATEDGGMQVDVQRNGAI